MCFFFIRRFVSTLEVEIKVGVGIFFNLIIFHRFFFFLSDSMANLWNVWNIAPPMR